VRFTQDYWLHKPLPEHFFLHHVGNKSDVVVENKRALWELGNRVNAYARDVIFLFPTLQNTINETEAWQYVYRNGAGMVGMCLL
jgi:hypothetical protein